MGNHCQRRANISPEHFPTSDLTPGRILLQPSRSLPILPLSLAIVAKEFSDRDSGASGGSATGRLTVARRQLILDMHRRQIRCRELQEALAAERLLVDDLVVALAIG